MRSGARNNVDESLSGVVRLGNSCMFHDWPSHGQLQLPGAKEKIEGSKARIPEGLPREHMGVVFLAPRLSTHVVAHHIIN